MNYAVAAKSQDRYTSLYLKKEPSEVFHKKIYP